MRDNRLASFNTVFKTGFIGTTITPLLPAHDLAIIVILNFCAGAGFLGLWIFNTWMIWRQRQNDKKY